MVRVIFPVLINDKFHGILLAGPFTGTAGMSRLGSRMDDAEILTPVDEIKDETRRSSTVRSFTQLVRSTVSRLSRHLKSWLDRIARRNEKYAPESRKKLRAEICADDDRLISQRLTGEAADQAYDRCIQYIRHENELLHHRTGWFLAIQGVLGAGAGFLFQRYYADAVAAIASPDWTFNSTVFGALIMWLSVCAIGWATSVSACRSIDAALYAQDSIDKHWVEHTLKVDRDRLPNMMGGSGNFDAAIGGAFAQELPVLTAGLWVLIADES